MGAVGARARFDLTRGWRSWLALAITAGVLGGSVIGLLAGSRQTERAYPTFLRTQRAFQQFMFTFEFYPGTASVSADRLASLPSVEAVTPGRVFDGDPLIVMRGSTDARLDRTLNVVHVLEGRLPEPTRPDEILVPLLLAEREGLQVGDTRSFRLSDHAGGHGPRIDARVVGIGIAPGEFPPDNDIGTTGWVHVTPAFVERYARFGAPFAYVFLRDGEDGLDAFQRELEEQTRGGAVIGYQQSALTKNVQRAFHLQAVSLLLLGAMLAAAGIVLVSQTISRLTWQGARDHSILSALGMSRSQLTAVGVLRVAMTATLACAIAVVVALAISPLMPTGRARLAILDPGVRLDLQLTTVGLGALIALMLGAALLPSFRAARAGHGAPGPSARPSRIAHLLQRAGAAPPATLGVRFALDRGQRGDASVARATMFSAALAVAAIALTLSFGAGLDNLLRTPRLYGSVFDLIGQPAFTATKDDGPALLERLRAVPGVENATIAAVGFPFRVEGTLADGEGIDPADTAFLPPLLSGRYPVAADEIAVGAGTLRAIDRQIGDTVQVSALGTRSIPFKIVGTAVVPTVGHSANLGEGSLLSMAAVERIFPPDDSMGAVLIRLSPGVDPAAVIPLVRQAGAGVLEDVVEPLEPGDLVNFGGQRTLPLILAGILAAMAVLTIGHGLLSTIPRKRRDIAVLRATGFTTGQSRATIGWQAGSVALAGLVIGLPVGAACGRILWLQYASRLGVLPEARTPFLLLALAVPVTLALALAASWWPARRAGRLVPAVVLRSE